MLLEKLKEFYEPEPLEIAEIYIFRKRMQRPEECAGIYGGPAKIIVTLQIWRIFANRIEKPIRVWIKKSENSIKTFGDG